MQELINFYQIMRPLDNINVELASQRVQGLFIEQLTQPPDNDIHFVESDAEGLDRCQDEDTSKSQLTNGIASASNQQLPIKGNT